jgi:hypothetical protein
MVFQRDMVTIKGKSIDLVAYVKVLHRFAC